MWILNIVYFFKTIFKKNYSRPQYTPILLPTLFYYTLSSSFVTLTHPTRSHYTKVSLYRNWIIGHLMDYRAHIYPLYHPYLPFIIPRTSNQGSRGRSRFHLPFTPFKYFTRTKYLIILSILSFKLTFIFRFYINLIIK